MPVHPDTPEPLKDALEGMEATVQSIKYSLAFASPEMQDFHWGRLQENLAGIFERLYQETLLQVIENAQS